jgi:hypothetical protein
MEELKSSDDVKEEPLDIDFKNKQTEQQTYQCDFGEADPYVKGQLILDCSFGVFKLTKKPTNFL